MSFRVRGQRSRRQTGCAARWYGSRNLFRRARGNGAKVARKQSAFIPLREAVRRIIFMVMFLRDLAHVVLWLSVCALEK